jgi:subtilisin family serine protease
MKRVCLSLIAVLVALPLLAAGPKEAKLFKAKGKKVADSYIVVLEDRVAEDVDAVADDLVFKHRGRKDHVYKSSLKGFSARLSEKEALALAADPRVAYVEEDAEVTAYATQSGATWGIDRVDQRNLPLSGTYTYNYDGTGVKAYIIDTGIKVGHTQFGSRRITGYDAVTSGGSADDCNGHGTHVAGTVGGSTYGLAKNVTLVAVRVLDCNGSGTNSGVIAGVDWVTSNHASGAPAVANMSLGGGASTALDDAVRRSIADGVTYAIASGNDNANACNYSPARVSEAITVNSTTSSDARSSFSNWGTCTDIFAPGSSITSAWYSSTTATNTISGTSMATPHVAGVVALYLDQFGYQSPANVASALINNSTANKVTSAGTGSPNRLLYSLWSGGGTPAPSISGFSPTSGGVGTSVTITGADFTGATAVSFNNQSASFTVNSSTQITATVPNCSSSGQVRVTTAGGTATSSGSFSVTGCGGGTPAQLLLNPGFELGNNGNWTQTSGVIDSSTGRPSRTGSWKAWLCGYGTSHTDYIYQTKTIPSTATSATLTFWVRIDSAETTTSIAYDKLNVQISTNGGSTYTTLATYSNLNENTTYVQKSFDLSAYRGLSVRVRLYATEDSSLQTSFVVDDTALNVQ